MNPRVPTTQKLADALTKAGAPKQMIQQALGGQYDDFKSDSATPINLLVADARRFGLTKIAEQAINGDFDAQDWESDEWANSEDGKATFKEFGL